MADNTSFYELTGNRVTCRDYLSDPVPEEVLSRILNAVCTAPNAGNFQNISVIAVDDSEKKHALAQMSRGQKYIEKAPISFIFCVDHNRIKRIAEAEYAPVAKEVLFEDLLMGFIDATIAAQTMVLAAESEGLRSCYNGNVLQSSDVLSEMLNLPKRVVPVIMLTIGYPRYKTQKKPPKYPKNIMVFRNSYENLPLETLQKADADKFGDEKHAATDILLKEFFASTAEAKDEEFARKGLELIQKRGYFTANQYWLGVYYPRCSGEMKTRDFVRFFKDKEFEI